MANQAAMMIRFNGDPDELLRRYLSARDHWLETRDPGCNPPMLHAVLSGENGIVVINGFPDVQQAHMFGRSMGACMKQAGLRPAGHERSRIEKLQWR